MIPATPAGASLLHAAALDASVLLAAGFSPFQLGGFASLGSLPARIALSRLRDGGATVEIRRDAAVVIAQLDGQMAVRS